MSWEKSENEENTNDEEEDDNSDFDEGEPVFEFTETADVGHIDKGKDDDTNEGGDPPVDTEPTADELAGGSDFRTHDHDEHEPIEPPSRKTSPLSKSLAGIR